MAKFTIPGVESIRIVRAAGNLTITGRNPDRAAVEVDAGLAPEVSHNAGVAELTLGDNATIAVPAGVAVEVEDLAGNLDLSDLAAPLVVGRVPGNLHARRIGAISIRDTVAGNVSIKQAGAVEGLEVRGALEVESARAIAFSHVVGHFDCRDIDGEVAIEKIAGGARLLGLRGPFIARIVGGHLEVEDAAHVEAGLVGGKVRAFKLSGGIRIGKIGGKLVADNVADEIAVGFVGSSARVARLSGALNLEDVGGAVYLAGPFPADRTWSVRSGGRVNLELDADASIELDASAGWGRIRTYGLDAAGLRWLGHDRVHGPIGPAPASGARTKLAVETRHADVIVFGAGASERDFAGRAYRSRMSFDFSAPFEDLAAELGSEVPAFVRSVLDAVGQFVAQSGGMSGKVVREVSRDLKRSLSEGLREIERAISEIEKSVPGEAGERLAKLGRELGDLVADAVRGGSREARDEMRERVRQAAREMRDKIQKAAREVRNRAHGETGAAAQSAPQSATQSATQSNTQSEAEQPAREAHSEKSTFGATKKLGRDDAILEILAAVKDGHLEPDEADDLINAWMEVARAADPSGGD